MRGQSTGTSALMIASTSYSDQSAATGSGEAGRL